MGVKATQEDKLKERTRLSSIYSILAVAQNKVSLSIEEVSICFFGTFWMVREWIRKRLRALSGGLHLCH